MKLTHAKILVEIDLTLADETTRLIQNGNTVLAKEKIKEYLENELVLNNVKKKIKNIDLSVVNKNVEKPSTPDDCIKELAARLDGNECNNYMLTEDNLVFALENDLVIAYSIKPDVLELEGKIKDISTEHAIDGFKIKNNALLDKNAKTHKIIKGKAKISNKYQGTQNIRVYSTDVPHEKFLIYKDSKPYCYGIVFSVDSL